MIAARSRRLQIAQAVMENVVAFASEIAEM